MRSITNPAPTSTPGENSRSFSSKAAASKNSPRSPGPASRTPRYGKASPSTWWPSPPRWIFSLLGANAAIGRTFSSNDLGNACTVVLAHHFWEQKLGAPPNIAGHSLTLGKSSCEIVGVMPKSFAFYPVITDGWTLITPTSEFAQKPWHSMVGAFGLLKPGISRAAAEAELTAIQARVALEMPPDLKVMRDLTPDVLDLHSNFTWLAGRNLRKGLWMLLGASTLILLLAALNVGSLVLSRSIARAREMAIRAAIGASRRRLIGQAFTESLLLGILGTTCGVLVAAGLLQWFRAANPIELPPGARIALDVRVLLFTACCGIAASVLFGVFPAWRASRADVNAVMKSGNLGQGRAAGPLRATESMVVLQVALSMILLAGAGLLSESLWKMASADVGYRAQQLFTARIEVPDSYADAGAQSRLAESVEAGLETLPGIRSVALASDFVPGGFNPIAISGKGDTAASDVAAQDVSPAALQTLGIPLLRGRMFDSRDGRDAQQVAMINAALAKEYFAGADPLGARIKLSRADDASTPWLTIIGIAADVKTTTVFQEMGYIEPPAVYRPLAQSPAQSLALMIAVNGSPLALVSEIQQRLSSLDPNLILGDIDGLRARQAVALSQPRFRSVLFSGFAVLALVLALVGLYGVLAQAVTRRSRDIGIRMALGATRDRVLRAVLGQACTMTIAGIVIGGILAAVLIRVLRGMLYGIAAQGTGELGIVAIALLMGAVAAAWAPAYRAASVDPMRVLRDE
ncbi:MAG TPA: ADOP family duplicated permease [Candidatus Sulfopaludibacter sp.]|nr:ADOP family duplicated permease [Candidatus Sulfopaludibacter sp.]